MDQSPSGRLLVMELDYLPILEIFVSAMFIPHEDCTPFHDGGFQGDFVPLQGSRGGSPPPAGGSGGQRALDGGLGESPPMGGSGATTPKPKIR